MSEHEIFIVDDDPAVRDSLAVLLEVEGYRVRVFDSAESFLEAWTPQLQGGLLLDVRMPGMDGLELLERLNKLGNHLPVVVMTGHGDVPLAVRSMKLGALDFIEKPLSDTLLLEAVRTMIAYEKERQERCREQQEIAARLAELTPRERDVLEKLVLGQPNKVIAYELDISARTVEVHRARVMEKMKAKSLSHLVRMALQAGIEV
ncbi:MAG TPA: response regulator FixJ [Kiloniellales bacterium]|nr:response regulator FixJ [Kiloniellales bacterium]